MDQTLALDDAGIHENGSDAEDQAQPTVVSLCTHVSHTAVCAATHAATHLSCMQAGTLTFGTDVRELFTGVNVVGRKSEDENRNRERAEKWKEEHRGVAPVSTVLIDTTSISSQHAIICEYNEHWTLQDWSVHSQLATAIMRCDRR